MRKVRVIAELIRCLPQDGTILLTLSWAVDCVCLALLLRMHVLPRSVMKPFSGRVSISGPRWIYSSNCVYFYNTHNLSSARHFHPDFLLAFVLLPQILCGI